MNRSLLRYLHSVRAQSLRASSAPATLALRPQFFDSQSVGTNSGALFLNGVTYDFTPSGYRIAAVDHANYLCIAGTCLSNNASDAFWTITLSNPVDRVGGYLSGAGDNLVASQTDITYYDANDILLGGTFNPIPQAMRPTLLCSSVSKVMQIPSNLFGLNQVAVPFLQR